MAPVSPTFSIQFLGAAGTVTGSKTLISTAKHRILVDCGLFQGLKPLRERNWNALPIPASSISDVVLTHGHLDHVGFLPRLYREGFRGLIHANRPTEEIAEIVLRDSGRLQEEEAEQANRKGYSRHQPALALYTEKDALAVMALFVSHEPDQWIVLNEEMKFRMQRNGHIPGSVFLEFQILGKRLVFSGDVGRKESLLLAPPHHPDACDYLVLESTYGNRLHAETSASDEMADLLAEARHRGGPVIIPSFAVSRAQEIILLLHQLKAAGRCPDWPIVLDSPMALDVFQVLTAFPEWHTLGLREIRDLARTVRFVHDARESREMVADNRPKIVIAGAGMVTGGRVLSYLERWLGDARATVVLSGYQSAGTRGRDLQEGKKHIRFFGQDHLVVAPIRQLTTLSAHGDQNDLVHFVRKIPGRGPSRIFLNHGEPDALQALKSVLEGFFDAEVTIPQLEESFTLG